jgi:hypothetical protein
LDAKANRKSFTEDHFAALLDAAHQQLGGPILLVWDGLPQHKSARTTRRANTVYQCPDCDGRYLGRQWCHNCNKPCTRLGAGGSCPHYDGARDHHRPDRMTLHKLQNLQMPQTLIPKDQ